ncbi:dihydrodipicolinate synthase family protein [Proteiniphilum sp. UBA1028]|jgi:4-hydroxy-tetrahydrodipicolinate synthase|uniref:dihydrodipicolinate synthase family protein n=1 Tax=Proteiniphilum sp. UBA1028 TaxID=1947251 RepID=UPI0025D2811F|nr:dihydrodipicolinate synthase family protein [Proteiniphilum sp. UBA1028]
MQHNLSTSLTGIIVPLVTPLSENNILDINGLNNLIDHVIKGGVSGIFLLGTTGEAQNLSYKLRKELIKATCEKVDSRIPVLVGITDTSIEESAGLADYAARCGVSALVAAPPYYYIPGQAELLRYYETLAANIALPLYLYNMPANVKIYIEYQTVLALAENPRIIGLKDSSANGVYFQKLLYSFKKRPFSLFVGPEEMMAETVLMGGHGGVNGGANLYPELYVNLYKAAINKDFETIGRLQAVVMEISNSLYSVGRYGSSYLKGLKTALELKGICSDTMSEPFQKFEKRERDILVERLERIDAGMKQAMNT